MGSMTKMQYIIRYEKESGNKVLNNDRIVDGGGTDIGKFTIELAKNYHDIVLEHESMMLE